MQRLESSLTLGSIEPGQPYPLGAHWDGAGVNFALFSQHATKVELCLFDSSGRQELPRIALGECSEGIWHGYLPGAQPGLLYGYRVHGPYEPEHGQRFNPNKLLLDPYAREIHGTFRWDPVHFGYDHAHPRHNLSFDARDNAPQMLKARVTHEDFDWGEDCPPRTPWTDTILYETHVKGFTMLHPGVPERLRGSYAGMASEAVIRYLRELGVTAVELLPVHYRIDESHLTRNGLTNYWGYNTLGFFAPEPRYQSPASRLSPVNEFKAMVKALHAAGIEVILDVVYNHTAEGDQNGPTLSFRGLDNLAYYRLKHSHPRHYENFSGCGNTLNLSHPRVLQMVMDSLRYWVTEMRVDGFRFDLATILGRENHGFDPGSGFLDAIGQDPVLSRVKLIAEPWDIGLGGYQVGGFPPGWSEWNDKYRDTLRGFWLHRAASRGELAHRLTASSDVFNHDRRRPQASINFITAHDGFTLRDLLSYSHKHNEANGENNRDGHSDNRSWNCGIEGPTKDAAIIALRRRLQRTLLASLLFSQGVPMLLAGDELGRSQQGNNNAYCQDNTINWVNWEAMDCALLEFTAGLIALRKKLPVFRQSHWLSGAITANGCKDITWLAPDGTEMSNGHWDDPAHHCFGFHLAATTAGEQPVLVLHNAEGSDVEFALPPGQWIVLVDTALDEIGHAGTTPVKQTFLLPARSLVVLQRGATAA